MTTTQLRTCALRTIYCTTCTMLQRWMPATAAGHPGECVAVSPSVVSPSSRTAVVWKHFGFSKDENGKLVKDSRAICKLCGQKVAHGGGTTNLKNHLRTKHRSTYDELFSSNSSEREQGSLDAFVTQLNVLLYLHVFLFLENINTVDWLTDSFLCQLTGYTISARFTALQHRSSDFR